MLVVGLMLPFIAFAIELLLDLFHVSWQFEAIRTIAMPATVGGVAMVAVAAFQLVDRTRGYVRWSMLLAGTCYALVTLMYLTTVMAPVFVHSDDAESTLQALTLVIEWGVPIGGMVAVLAFAIAAGKRGIVVGVLATALQALLLPVPPVRTAVWGNVEFGTGLSFLIVGLFAGQAVLVAFLGTYVGDRGRERARDHLRSARGLLALSLAAVAQAGAVLAVAILGTSLRATVLEAVAAVAVLAAMWWLARTLVFDGLAAIAVCFALAAAIGTVLVIGNSFAESYRISLFMKEDLDLHAPGLVVIGGMIAFAWVLVALALYRKVKRTAITGAAYVVLTGIGIVAREHRVVTGFCLIAASLLLVPLFREAARVVAADPVKTTADVFA